MDNQDRRQKHFNKAYLGVIAQGEPAINGALCSYLTTTGSKCSVGHILTEDELKLYGHCKGPVRDLYVAMGRPEDHPFYTDRSFYEDMQEVHDNLMYESGAEFVSSFKQNMKLFAAKYKLEVPEHE